MTTTSTHPRTGLRPSAWRTLDLVATAVIGVAFGVVYWGWSAVYSGVLSAPVYAVFGPLVGILSGPWLLAGVVAALVVRRPGAALLAEVVAAYVEPLLGNEWGWTTLYSGLLQGAGVELAVAIFLFRRFNLPMAMLGGALAALFECCYEWQAYYSFWQWDAKIAYLGFFALSGIVVAGIGGYAVSRALAASGAVDGLAGGRARALTDRDGSAA